MKGNGEPPSPTVGAASAVTVVGADEQQAGDARVDVDVDRWCRLAALVLEDEGRRGELTLTFVDRDEIAALNAEHMGKDGPTDVLSFPLDDPTVPDPVDDDSRPQGVSFLGDVVVAPTEAERNNPTDPAAELRLLLVHGILHLLGYDHEDDDERTRMWERQERYSGVRAP
jgi:probable rRNA maturation factor